jgi:hypothetical protein
MKKLILTVIVIAVIIAIPVLLLNRRPKESQDKVTRMAYAAMRSDLAGLMTAEQTTKLLRGRYVNTPEEAGHISSPGVTPPAIIVSDTGWSATVGFKTIPGIRCGVGVYNRNPLKRLAKSGEVVCE